jgi:NADPH:quinone reductase-like Zn-dependent oxidoreductase
VLAAGVNPVDAKYIWGDKLCQCNCCEYCAIRLANGRIPGFDFAGIIEDAAETSKFKKGDEVFGILPPMKGSFADFILAPE